MAYEDEGFDGDMEQLLDMVDPSARGGHDFGPMYTAIERANRELAETPYSFIQMAILDDEGRALVDEYIQLGDWEAHAPINRRYGMLRDMRRRLAMLVQDVSEGDSEVMADESMDTWTESIVMAPLPVGLSEVIAGAPEAQSKAMKTLQREIEKLQADVFVDQQEGHFRDYTRWVESFQAPAEESAYDAGQKAVNAPFFHREARGFCATTQSDTRRDHSESLLARIAFRLGLQGLAQQRAAQTGGRGRRRRGGGARRPDYHDEETFD